MLIDACLPFLKLRNYRNARLNRAEIESLQRRQFRKLAEFVATRSPYYSAIMRERSIDPRSATPEAFPPLTKAELLARFDDIVTAPDARRGRLEEFLARSRDPREMMDGRYVVVHSSGTSGQLVIVPYTLREWVRGWVKLFHAVPVFGPIPRRAAFIGAANGHFATASLAVTAHWLSIGNFYRTRLFDINMPWSEILDGLNEFQPHNIVAYGSILGQLALEQAGGRLRIRPRTVICGGDILTPADEVRARAAFGKPVFQSYATTETLVLGMVEPRSDGMVLLEDDLWIEIEADRLLVTHLSNRTLPLIRYVICDTVVPAPSRSAPQHYRGYRRIAEVCGRREENLVLQTEDGSSDFIHPLLIVEFYVPGVDRFQVRQTGPTSFDFRVQPRANLSPAERDAVTRNVRARWEGLLAQKRMRNVRFQIELTDSLHHDARTGKFRLVETARPH